MDDKYIVSARKYRPQTFAGVVGQPSLTTTLRNAVLQERVAQAYLFCGPRGVGKTSCARIFAKTINCSNLSPEGEACGECDSCRDFERGHSYNVIELDAASNNGVDQMRALTEQVNIPPQVGRYRVFIIDEVHMLSSSAFNAFLKTLEEPPSYAVFILATTEKHKVIPTILSRCQVYDFSRITNLDIANHLKYVASQEGIGAAEEALDLIAEKADGGLRDALSIFDQVAASSGGNITYESTLENLNMLDYEYYFRFMEAFSRGDVTESLLLFRRVRDKGFDPLFFVNGLASHVRNLLMAADPRTAALLEVGANTVQRYVDQARLFAPKWYYAALKLLNDCDLNYRIATNKPLMVELTLIRLCQLIDPDPSPDGTRPLKEASPASGSGSSGKGSSPQSTPASARTEPQSSAAHSDNTPEAPRQQGASAPDRAASGIARGASAAAPSVSHSAKPLPSVGNLRHTLSLKGSRRKESATDAPRSAEMRATPIPPGNQDELWNRFVAENQDLKIVVNAILASPPVRTGEAEWSIAVENQAQSTRFEQDMPRIAGFFRDALNNDHFTLRVTINAAPQRERVLSPQDVLKSMVEANPHLAGLLNALDAELA